MAKLSWIAALVAPLALCAAAGARSEEANSEQPKVVAVEARPEAGRTVVRVETTSGSVNYISYTKSPTTVVVDLYGLEVDSVPAEIPVASAELRSLRFEYAPASRGMTSVARFILERTAPGPTTVRLEGTTVLVEARQAGRAASAPAAAASRRAPAERKGSDLPARQIDDVVAESRGDGLLVAIHGDGRLQYESFTLADPPRLVVDVHGVDNHVGRAQVRVDHPAVGRIRVSQFRGEPDKVSRVVLDLGDPRDYRVVATGNELRIGFGDATFLAEALDAAESPVEAGAETAAIALAEAAQGEPPQVPGGVSVGGTASEATLHGAPDDEEGVLVSLDLKDADIKDVLRYFSEISGLNIILDPGVSGTVTVRLIDVPWNKALDIILKSHGYGKTLEGNVLRIAEVSKLTQEESLTAELEKQKVEARPLVTFTQPVSYADAQQIATVVEKTALSTKGSIIIDQRTNTLVVTEVDIPEYRQRILSLIRTLDTPTPQVEIEARVVETTKTFARSFGIQWGFSHTFSQLTGSTTDLLFPNSGTVRGNMISQSGGFSSQLPGGGWAVNLPAPGANAAIGFHLANITDTLQLDMALSALENEGNGRVLSAPKITTQSNIAASIVSGASIPVQTVANNTITVQYLPVNLQLQVTPQVTAENTIVLKVTVDNSSPDLGTRFGVLDLPAINQRRATTQLMVADGGTAVIGGVFQLNESDTRGRIPFAHRLPVVGWLFKNTSVSRQNNELLIFITPKIKRPQGVGTVAAPVSIAGTAH